MTSASTTPTVAVCRGHRCAALAAPGGQAVGGDLERLKEAVGASRRLVLVSTGCLGLCAQAPVVLLSAGVQRDGVLTVVGHRCLGPVRTSQMAHLCDWLRDDASDSLPDALDAVDFTSQLHGSR